MTQEQYDMVWMMMIVVVVVFGTMIIYITIMAVRSEYEIGKLKAELSQLKTEVARLKAKLGEK